MKRFTILGGMNGAGKSTFAGVLSGVSDDFGTRIDADRITVQYGSAVNGGKAAVRLIEDCIRNGGDFIQETTLSGRKTVRTIAEAHENGYFVRLYYIAVSSVEESLSRIANRVSKGGHDISERIVRRRFARRFDDLLRILPLVDEAIFFDNENGFVRVADYRDGRLTVEEECLPEWLSELADRLRQ